MVNVNSQNKTINVNVSSSGASSNVNANGDVSQYYAGKAKEWATSNKLVDNEDYSAKYYANTANKSAISAQENKERAEEILNNTQASGENAINNIDNARNNAINELETVAASSLSEVNNAKIDAIEDLNTSKDEALEEIASAGGNSANKDLSNLTETGENKFVKTADLIEVDLDAKANTDLSNLSETGNAKFYEKADKADVLLKTDKSTISGWALPSSKYIDLTLGASVTSYTAPANGYYLLCKYALNQVENIGMSKFGQLWAFEWAPVAKVNLFCWVPVQKGETIAVSYNASGETRYFRFYYAEGEV